MVKAEDMLLVSVPQVTITEELAAYPLALHFKHKTDVSRSQAVTSQAVRPIRIVKLVVVPPKSDPITLKISGRSKLPSGKFWGAMELTAPTSMEYK